MEVLVNNKNLDHFLNKRFLSGAFLQSSLWRDFLAAQDKKFWQISVFKNQELIALCLLYENKLLLGKSYLYAPKGPVFKKDLTEADKEEVTKLILSQARDISIATKKREEIFLKMEPSDRLDFIDNLLDTETPHPVDTLFLELNKSHAELLGAMHQKTRYNIMLAVKKGVSVKVSEQEDDIETFLNLNKKTATRQNINTHPDEYYRLLWQVFLKHKAAKLYLAKVDKQVVAANLVINFGLTSTYLHGASDYQFRSFMAPYLLQWQAIKDAAANGFLYYDFWGIAPVDGSKPKWEGFTRFKTGFAGKKASGGAGKVFVYQPGFFQLYQKLKKIKKLFKI